VLLTNKHFGLTLFLVFLSLTLFGCPSVKLGIVSTKPVELGVEYEQLTSSSSETKDRWFIFDIPVSGETTWSDVANDLLERTKGTVLKNVEIRYSEGAFLGVGHEIYTVTGSIWRKK